MDFKITKHRIKQNGSVLVIVIVMLVVLTLMAVVGMQTTSIQERMAANMIDRNVSIQAAEAALREAEAFLQSAVLPAFDGTEGLHQPDRSLWLDSSTWDGCDKGFVYEYDGGIVNVKVLPCYIVEELPPVPELGASLASDEPIPDTGMYRVTARAVGGSESAEVILQTTYKR